MSSSDQGRKYQTTLETMALEVHAHKAATHAPAPEAMSAALDSAGGADAASPRTSSQLARADVASADVSILAVTGSFNPAAGILSVFGDNLNNNTTISRNAAGTILVNGGAVPVQGGTPTVANTTLIQVFGLGGNDTITLDESNGALPRANLFGGAGNDVLTGGAGGDQLFGQSDNDVLNGRGGFDFLFGGSGNDVLTGGDADDQMFGEGGDDRMIWNPGDDSDLMEGGAGNDTAEMNGGGGAEVFTITANGTRVRVDRVDPAPFFLDIGSTENVVINANGGDDTISATGNLAALTRLTIDGGAGNDTIVAGNGNDLLLGGDGNDFIDGQQGTDVAFLGAGEDTFQWDPGDGSDTVEGQDGIDTLLFNGSGGAEILEVAANGERARVTRNLGSIVMDLNDVETVRINALGNTDTITVGDMSGTDVKEVALDLAGVIGGTTGDGVSDVVTVRGSNAAETVEVVAAGTSATVLGLAARTSITNAERANDALVVSTFGGNDTISAAMMPAGVIKLTIDAGAGNDTIIGSAGADVLLGGDGNDFIDGGDGNDIAFLGAGDDTFVWNPGDDNDTLEGEEGFDTMLFNGANVAEDIDIVANGQRALFARNIASVLMDLNDVERIEFNALGGADNIAVGDLSGTDVTQIALDLAAQIGGSTGDGAIDTVTVNATNGIDAVTVSEVNGNVIVNGLQAQVSIAHAEGSNDRLVINGLAGNDTIDAGALAAGRISLQMNGGLGNDIFMGSQGGDFINGGDGNDVAFMGAGDDTFVWNPGDDNDTLEGQDGFDTMLFNGANVAEKIDIFANGERVSFTRDIAAVTMDSNDLEQINFAALGGADTINVGDVSGTDLTRVNIDLAATIGGTAGDGQADRVNLDATYGDDVILVAHTGARTQVDGLAAQVNVDNAESALDVLTIRGLGGSDVIDASTQPATAIQLVLDGGEGDDILIGGAGNDRIFGGAGDDVLIGNDGDDLLDGGAGDDVIIGGNGVDIEIQGFAAGAGSEDRIDLTSLGASMDFDWVMSNAREIGGNVVLDLGNETMTLRDVDLDALHADDFMFGSSAEAYMPVRHAGVVTAAVESPML